MTIKRLDSNDKMSMCVIKGDMLYTSGLTASDRSQDMEGQCRQILDKIDDYLAQAGSDKSKLMTAQIWLADIRDWAAFNDLWVAWIDPENPPTRATTEANLATRDMLIEIQVTAAL